MISLRTIVKPAAVAVVVAMALTVAGGQAHAKNGLLSILFPYIFPADEDDQVMRKRLDAEDTAPFAKSQETNSQAASGAGQMLDETTLRLDRPHRLPIDIEAWLTGQVSQILNISATDYSAHEAAIKPVMSEGGLAEYKAFIERSNTLQTLTTNNMKLTAYVENTPLLLNEAVLKGRYRWLYDVPMALTFVPDGTSSYQQFEPVNQYIMLRVQVGRIAPGTNEDDLQIETFEVRANSGKQKL